jgi:predicted TIM-barrel fold metal-dependent hydrolase
MSASKSHDFRIFDAHVHGYGAAVLGNPMTWGLEHNEAYWAKLHGPSSLQNWVCVDAMLREMDAAGVDKVLLQGWYWEQAQTCVEQNAWYCDWIQSHPDRIMAFAAFHPAVADIRGFLSARQDEGFCGIGELLPVIQGYSMLTDIRFLETCEWCQMQRWPMGFHVTEPVGPEYLGRTETPLNDFLKLAQLFPELKMILAHWGGGLPFFVTRKKVAPLLRNMWFDTAASPLLYEPQIWSQVVQAVGAEKILFGSDYPLCLYRRTSRIAQMSDLISEALNSSLTMEQLTLIFSHNLASVLPH